MPHKTSPPVVHWQTLAMGCPVLVVSVATFPELQGPVAEPLFWQAKSGAVGGGAEGLMGGPAGAKRVAESGG